MPLTIGTSSEDDLSDIIFGNKTPSAPVAPVPAPTEPPVVTPLDTAKAILEPADPLADLFPDLSKPAKPEPVTPPVAEAPAPIVPDPLKPVKAPETEVAESPEPDEEAYTRQVFKNAAKKLIEKGTWQDVEGFEEMELDEDSFQELQEAQLEAQIGAAWERVKSSNQVVNGILSVIEQGGNPDSIIDLFKEQQSVQQIDSTTPEGKLEVIGKFYSDIVGLTPAQVKSKLQKIDTAGDSELQSEFELAESRYNDHFQKEQTRIKKEETDRVAQQESDRQARIRQTAEALKAQGGTPVATQKLLRSMYQPTHGEDLSELDYQLHILRSDPVKSIELAQFVLDRSNYEKSLTQKAVNQTVDQTFGKLKFSPKKAVSSPPPTQPRSTASAKDLYSSILS